MKITIFSDGAARGNPGPGGWGAIVIGNCLFDVGGKKQENQVMELGGRENHTTNNRMELLAIIEALKCANNCKGVEFVIYTDSSYLVNGITKWVHGWKRNGWITKEKNDVLNRDLWEQLDREVSNKEIIWKKISGHTGIKGNERVDVIATSFADDRPCELYSGSISNYAISNILDIKEDKSLMNERKRKEQKAYSYVSLVDGVIEVHHSWKECEERVKGAKGARYRKAIDFDNEKEIIDQFGTL